MIIMLLYENKYFVEKIEIRKNMLKDLTVSLTRLAKFLTTHQRRILIRAFIESQFNYCRLVWMFHSRKLGIIIYKKDRYVLFMAMVLLPLKNYLVKMNLLQFTIATYKL